MSLPAKSFYTILGIDPGKTNAAYSVVRIKLRPFRFKILAHGMLKHPVQDLTGPDLIKRFNVFKREVRKLKSTYHVDAVFAERFMTRGGGQSMGTTIEVVSVMLALLAHVGIKSVQLVTAAQWKNQWNRHNDLKEFYKLMHPLPAHPIDATGIALYGASQLFEEIPCFAALGNIKQLIKQIKESNKEPVNEKRSNRGKNKDGATPSSTSRKRKAPAQKANTEGRRGSVKKTRVTSATRGSSAKAAAAARSATRTRRR